MTFVASATTENGGPWLGTRAVEPLPAGGSAQFAPEIRTAGLARGTYRGRVTLTFSNGTSAVLRVALVVIPPRTTSLTAEGARQVGACQPNQTIPVVTELGGGGPPAAGWAQPISVQVVDDCGNPVRSGSATAQYSGVNSPETPLTAIGSVFSGSWTPPLTEAQADVRVTVTVTDPAGNTGSATETVRVQPNELAPPVVAEGGVVHAASFARRRWRRARSCRSSAPAYPPDRGFGRPGRGAAADDRASARPE